MAQDNRSLEELANAEIVPEKDSGNTWLVRFGENDYDHVNKTGKNTLILKDDVLDRDSFTFGGVTVEVDWESGEYRLTDGSRSAEVPPDKEENVLWSIYDEDGDRLNRLLEEFYEERVRVGVMDWFMPRFRAARESNNLRKVEGGWLVNESVLVRWDGSNEIATDVQTHRVTGGGTQATDGSEARSFDFGDVPSSETVETPGDREIELTETELRFLATVEAVLEEEGYGSGNGDTVGMLVDRATVNGFTDEKSGLFHGHGLQKHTLDMLGVTAETSEKLHFNSHDHAGVHELAHRRQEFEHAPFAVFEDVVNEDPDMWEKIENTREMAPIPQQVRDSLDQMYS